MKFCKGCNTEKELSLFWPSKTGGKGVGYYCKVCTTDQVNKWYKKNRDRQLAKRRIRDRGHLKDIMFCSAKARAKERNIEFNITIDDIIIPDVCPVLGIKLENNIGKGKRSDGSPSLDRIDNSKGYVTGNVCIISDKANKIKNSGTIEEHQKIIDYMNSHK